MYRVDAVEAQTNKLHGDVFITQPVSATVTTGIIVAIIALVAVVVVTGSYARVEQGIGYLVPTQGLAKIQTSQFGTVEKILKREGDLVKKGDKLALIKLVPDNLQGVSPVVESLQALHQQEQSIDTQIHLEQRQLESQLAQLESVGAELQAELRSLQSRLELQKEITVSTLNAFESSKALITKGYVSQLEHERHHQNWLAQKVKTKQLEQDIQSGQAELEQIRIRLNRLPDESKQRVAELGARRAVLAQNKIELENKRHEVISSPVDGKIISLNNQAEGRTVNAGEPFLTILPTTSRLQAEVFVPSRAIGFIESGQEVRLLYDAFPYQRFGSYSAVVRQVTEIVLSPHEVNAPFTVSEPVYRITVEPASDVIQAKGKQVAIQSGMTLKANIVLERQSFLSWLLAPLKAARERS